MSRFHPTEPFRHALLTLPRSLASSNRLSLRRATFLSVVMSVSVRGLNVVRNTILTSPEGGMATPLAVAQTLNGPQPERVASTVR